jgi:uncharacterized protein
MPVHPLSAASVRAIVPGQITREDIQIFPTFAAIPARWRLRVTITTSDTPHLFATATQLPGLLGGVYAIERHAGDASLLNVPLAPASAFTVSCGSLCSAEGP